MSLRTARPFEPTNLRKTILEMAFAGSTVHIGCAFSIVELLAVLYRDFLRYPGNDPLAEGRDYLVLSKGHGVMAQYACMRELNWIDDSQISQYFADGTDLKGLSDSRVPGLEVTSGSLGHGFSVGVGLALASKLKGSDQRIFVLVGDGELNEGAIWEGAMFAAHSRLENFVVLVDENGFQAMGATRDVLALGSLSAKFSSFGFDVAQVDGHDESAIKVCLSQMSQNADGRPKALIAKTVKGKGVPFMENDNSWHYTRLDSDSYARALHALENFAQ